MNLMEIVTDDKKFNYIMQIPEKFDSYVARCKSRKIKFKLNFAQFDRLVKKSCHYCKFKSEEKINGIDRVNPNNGYTLVNSVPCCWNCNRAKSNMPYSEFQDYISRFKSIE